MQLYWESIVFTGVAFLILYWLLSRYAFGPLFSIMEKRKELVVGELSRAQEDREKAASLLEEQKQAIQDARKEALEIIEQARKNSVRQADEMLADAKAEAERLKGDALKDIESEKNKAIVALKSQVSAMSVLIASKIIEKQIDEKSQEQLIDRYLSEVGGGV